MSKKNFSDIFKVDFSSGTVTPKEKRVSINGSIINPGDTVKSGTLIGGIDLFELKDKDFKVEEKENTLILKSYYR